MMRFDTCLILLKDIELVFKHATNIWRDVYHINRPIDDLVEIKDDDSDQEDEEDDNIPLVTITKEDMQDLMKEKEEEEKEEEAEEEDKDEEDLVIITIEIIASLPHSPPKTITSSMETTSASEIVSTSASSVVQSSPATSQLQVSSMEVSSTSSTELQVTSLATTAPTSSSTVSVSDSSIIFLTLALSTSTSIPISSRVDISICVPPSARSILGNISAMDLVGILLGTSSISPIPLFTVSPSISTIVSIPKVKSVIPKVELQQPLKLLITKKEIDEDIDLDTTIKIPKIDYDTTTIEEMRLVSQLLEKKARQKKLRSERDKEYRIIESAKNIIIDAIGVEVNSTQHILVKL